MVYNFQEVLKKYKNRRNIEDALKKEILFKVAKGVYSDEKNANPLVVAVKKYPNAVVTMDSAFYYYKLTDVIPLMIYVATNRNSNPIKMDKIKQTFMDKSILNEGKTTVMIDGEEVSMYDKERLLVELVRKRGTIPFDYYKEIIGNYRDISEELDMYKIEDYCSLFKNGDNLLNILQREVF